MALTFIHNSHSWAAQWMSKGLHGHRQTWNRSQQYGVEARVGMWAQILNRIGPGEGNYSSFWEPSVRKQFQLQANSDQDLAWSYSLHHSKILQLRGQVVYYYLEKDSFLGPLSFCWHSDSNLETNTRVHVILETLQMPSLEDKSFSLIVCV